jgi:ABC-type branched-subunit amino acid transport system substrate-binding protein
LAAAVVPACDVAGNAAAAPATAGCLTPGITKDQVEVGLLYPDTGNAASIFLPFRAGVDARLGVANANGGVFGRAVRYSWRDDASRSETNFAAARSLVDGEQVFGIIESTSVAGGSAEFLYNRGIPVTGVSLETAWTKYDNMFSYSNMIADERSVSTWGDFVAARGGRTAVVAEASFSDTSIRFSRALRQSLQAAGVRVVQTVDVTGRLSPPEIGKTIKDSGADVLVGALTGGAFDQVVAYARGAQADLRVILSPTGYDESLLRLLGVVLADVYYFIDFLPFERETPVHREFLDAMAAYAPQMQPPNQQTALSGWLAADMFLRGLQAAGRCPTREGFIGGLRAVRDYDARGLLPDPIDFGAAFGKLNRCYTFVQVSSDGKRFQAVEPVPLCGSSLD